MLQQTQVPRVVGTYRRFVRLFPSPASLARAPLARALEVWQGLGYNRRCLNLHRAAALIVERHGGRVPRAVDALEELPGVGPYTARAVAAFAYRQPVAFVDTNIRRVIIYHYFRGAARVVDGDVLAVVERTLDRADPRGWFNALMDYGAYLAGAVENPNRRSAGYARQGRFEGSRRQLRGRVIGRLLEGRCTAVRLARELGVPQARLAAVLRQLAAEGFLRRAGKLYAVR